MKAILTFSLALLVFGCASPDERPTTLPGGYAPPPATSPCREGDTKICSIVTSVREGYVDCAPGSSTCVEGEWGPCEPPGGNTKFDGGSDG